MAVPNTHTFSLRDDVIPEIISPYLPMNSLHLAFKYSKSPQFNPLYGTNVGINSLEEFRDYQVYPTLYRTPKSEIVSENPIKFFPNNEAGHVEFESLTGVIDAQYDSTGDYLYAITSNTIYFYNAVESRYGTETSMKWTLSSIYPLPSGDTFSTEIKEDTSTNYMFVGTTQGRFLKLSSGVLVYEHQYVYSQIMAIDISWYGPISGGIYTIIMWYMDKNGQVYFSEDHGVTFQNFNIGIPGGGTNYLSFVCANNMSSTGLMVRWGIETYYQDYLRSSPWGLYQMPKFFQHTYPRYNALGTRLADGVLNKDIVNGNVYSLYNFASSPPSTIRGVMQVYMIDLEVSETAGVIEYYTGYILLNMFWRSSGYPGWQLFSYSPHGYISKNTGLYTLYTSGEIRHGSIVSSTLIEPHVSVNYFAVTESNENLTFRYPTYTPYPTSYMAIDNISGTFTAGVKSDFSYYKVVPDSTAEGWLTVYNSGWNRNSIIFDFAVTPNTTGESRFTWIHALNGDNNRIIASLGITQVV